MFQQKLDNIVKKNNSLVCVGLDPVAAKLPAHLQDLEFPFFQFNKAIIDATHDVVCALKPNSAFYEGAGEKGVHQLKLTCHYIKEMYPEIPIILDAKRADIGNTNEGYADFAFDYLQADAITVQPYFGKEALKPFLDLTEKGIIILCKTSNVGSDELQNQIVKGKPVYQIVANNVVHGWNQNNNCLLVVGATYPEELAEVRRIVGDMTILVPGIGAQGGDVEKTLQTGLNSQKAGLIINSSRGVIYASSGEDFAQKAREEAIKLKNKINEYR